MKNFLYFFWSLIFILSSHFCFGQYSISGYLDSDQKNKKVYLSLLQYDEESSISKEQVLISTLTDSTGYFNINGKLLSNKHKLYRIHSNIQESPSLDFADSDDIKNFHNFIFSNSDTIVFEKNEKFWFSKSVNSNPIDKEWREFNGYKNRLRNEFSGTRNLEAKHQSSSQFLAELKSHIINENIHPLVSLISLSDIQDTNLKQDFKGDSKFYTDLQSELDKYYNNRSYALQFKDLISSLSILETEKQLSFYKKIVYTLSLVIILLLISVFILLIRIKRQKAISSTNELINLTKQEQKIADLIFLDKTNKEIATELFISLSTVKTHIRNLYAKLEVSSRQQFVDKLKNHPRD